MTESLTLHTGFADVSEFTEGMAQRVDEENIMLLGSSPITENEWVEFAVLLADGTPALQGVGRCVASIDNGEAMAPEHRFDIVLDSLRFDGTAQVVYERILLARDSSAQAGPPTGEIMIDDTPGGTPVVVESVPPQDAGWQVGTDEVQEVVVERGFLSRPSVVPSWTPDDMPLTEASRPSSGLFVYEGGIPLPERPPRPDGYDSQRISPAPRPSDRPPPREQ